MTDATPKKLVYVSGPYTKPDPAQNVWDAVKCADKILEKGYIPVIPHLSHLWHIISPKTYDVWMEIDIALLKKCDIIFRMSGESPGADQEVDIATMLGIPVIKDMDKL